MFADALLREFKREARGLTDLNLDSLARTQVETLARHHGLPSISLDWTRSPYVAAFFAFDDPVCQRSECVSVWVLDRQVFIAAEAAEIEFPEEDQILSTRAIEQMGVVVRVLGVSGGIATMIPRPFLTRFDIPASERLSALRDMESMRLTSRALFRDLDGAARTVTRKLIELPGGVV